MPAGSITVHPETPESYTVELEEGGYLSIGRKPDASGRKKLVLAVPEVSGQHAEIRHTPDGWTIRDSGSTNGTRLNGERLTPGREYVLRSGDRVKIAQIDLVIELERAQAPAATELSEDELHEKTHLRIQLINATILVGDLKDFTTLMEAHADNPDVVMQAAQRVFESMNEEIRNNHGQIEKIMGDAIMAYWQGDESGGHPDRPAIRACYTALRLRSLVAALAQNREYWPFNNHTLKVDIALASGPVAAGALGHGEASPALLGDTANLAFRIEKLITDDFPGDIIVDGATQKLAQQHFKFTECGEVNVKGRQKKVDVHSLLDLQGLPSRDWDA